MTSGRNGPGGLICPPVRQQMNIIQLCTPALPRSPGLRHSIARFPSLTLLPDTLWCNSYARKLANIAAAEDGRSPSFDGECPSPGTATSMIPKDSNVPKDITLAMSSVKKVLPFLSLLIRLPHVYSQFSVQHSRSVPSFQYSDCSSLLKPSKAF